MFRLFNTKALLAFVLAIVLGGAIYGFAAGVTFSDSPYYAGDGEETVGGYTVNNVDFSLNGSNPANIDSVAFDITPADPTEVQIEMVDGSGTWYSCTLGVSPNWSCDTTSGTQLTVANADQIRIVAVSD